jgi:hypothetical protein
MRAALVQRGITLLDCQAWGVVTGRPERLSLPILAAL